MRSIVTGLCMVVMSAGLAAGEDVMAAFYGNTWEFRTKAEYPATPIHVNRDHTFSMWAEKKRFNGTWHVDGQRVCFVAEHEVCFSDIAGRKVDEPWTGTNDEGEYLSVIRKGRS